MVVPRDPETWTSVPIARIEDLHDAVLGAGLEATQMSTALLSGDLAFAKVGDVIYSSGLLNGQIALRGPLSRRDLICGAASGRTIYEIAAAWGIGEPGRMAGCYRDMFGEYPHETVDAPVRHQRREATL